jgi:hypothetical protein
MEVRISQAENIALLKEPTQDKIRSMVFHMKKDKSPGIDGLTAETLQARWDFIGETCIKVVTSFWQDGYLPKLMLAAVIKLIYKGGLAP